MTNPIQLLVLELTSSRYQNDQPEALSVCTIQFSHKQIIFVKPSKSDMLPTMDKNADMYYYRYYFRYNNENMIGTVPFILHISLRISFPPIDSSSWT